MRWKSIGYLLAIGWLASVCLADVTCLAAAPRRPNVLLIMTDDQGWGDFGFHGNPHLKTPHLDALAARSVELTQFYVSPVCSPTRASLLTGRYNYRTGAIDTYLGRSTMVAEEVTLAEMLAAAGYRTGIFGKWHLGDNYPSRSIDQGFQESFVHRGGGIAQAADPPGNTYFDPILMHNGREEKSSGYCSDVFTRAAMRFIAQPGEAPFFAYLAFNCPHTPLQVPVEYHKRYQSLGLDEQTEKVYGMIANIDDNLGRLFAHLKELKLDGNTIIVFLTDNGPQMKRYNGVLNDLKGSVYDGGIHVPCLICWPGAIAPGRKLDQVAAHIDLVPTLLEACGVPARAEVKFDGTSLLAVLRGQRAALPERTLFFQWHRGDVPQLFRACAARSSKFKLVQAAGRGDQAAFSPSWELYDMSADPGERHNVLDAHADVAARLKTDYERWFADVSGTRGFPPPKIIVGTPRENPTILTRQDWRGPRAGWRAGDIGSWQIELAEAGPYDVTVRFDKQLSASTARLHLGSLELSAPVAAGAERAEFRALQLDAGAVRVEATLERPGAAAAGVQYVDIARRAGAKP